MFTHLRVGLGVAITQPRVFELAIRGIRTIMTSPESGGSGGANRITITGGAGNSMMSTADMNKRAMMGRAASVAPATGDGGGGGVSGGGGGGGGGAGWGPIFDPSCSAKAATGYVNDLAEKIYCHLLAVKQPNMPSTDPCEAAGALISDCAWREMEEDEKRRLIKWCRIEFTNNPLTNQSRLPDLRNVLLRSIDLGTWEADVKKFFQEMAAQQAGLTKPTGVSASSE